LYMIVFKLILELVLPLTLSEAPRGWDNLHTGRD
jgi:hypothetical protein